MLVVASPRSSQRGEKTYRLSGATGRVDAYDPSRDAEPIGPASGPRVSKATTEIRLASSPLDGRRMSWGWLIRPERVAWVPLGVMTVAVNPGRIRSIGA